MLSTQEQLCAYKGGERKMMRRMSALGLAASRSGAASTKPPVGDFSASTPNMPNTQPTLLSHRKVCRDSLLTLMSSFFESDVRQIAAPLYMQPIIQK